VNREHSKKGRNNVMRNGRKIILYLDRDPSKTITMNDLPELQADIIPLTAIPMQTPTTLPSGVHVLTDESLTKRTDSGTLYNPPETIIRQVRTLTLGDDIDVIVVGNNTGAGLFFSLVIPKKMRPMTIITSHTEEFPEKRLYLSDGYTHIVTRYNLHLSLRELLIPS
jgi:hypothetical protein